MRLCRTAFPPQPCRDAREAEALLARDDLQIVAASGTPGGIQEAQVLTLRTGGDRPVVFRAKWRAQSTASARNSPRLELAAYAVQKLFLDADEYVAPPAAGHCFPLEMYREHVDPAARPTFPGVACVYGTLSYWLEDVTPLADAVRVGWFKGQYDHALDPELFRANSSYRDSIARVNLFTHLIQHRDTHSRNFVIALDGPRPIRYAVYSVDNSLSFGLTRILGLLPWHDWSVIRVPAVPRSTIDRLRTASDRLSSLGAITVLRAKNGRLVVTRERSLATTTGTDWKDGELIVGLTAAEIGGLRDRIAAMIARVDRGELPVY